MRRGNLRFSEEQYAAETAKRTRWQRGSEVVNTQRPVAESTAALPISAAGAPSLRDRPIAPRPGMLIASPDAPSMAKADAALPRLTPGKTTDAASSHPFCGHVNTDG